MTYIYIYVIRRLKVKGSATSYGASKFRINSRSSTGFPVNDLGISCIAFGTKMYLLGWGSFPSLLLTDMMKSLPSRTRAYLVKI